MEKEGKESRIIIILLFTTYQNIESYFALSYVLRLEDIL